MCSIQSPPAPYVVDSKENWIASRIVGNWTFIQELSDRLSKDGLKSDVPVKQMLVTFTDEPEVLDEIPEDNCAFLKKNGMKIFLAGKQGFAHVDHGLTEFIYVLTSTGGVPAVIYWQDVTPVINLVQLAPAKIVDQDLLFIGSGNSDQPFGVLHRLEGKPVCDLPKQ